MLLSTPCLLAEENTSLTSTAALTFSEKQRSWSRLNYYSPTEGYHSKGSYGLHVGLGALSPGAPDKDAPISESARRDMGATRPRFYLSKGTPWPLDFGLSYSYFQDESRARQGGAHIQWTIYEGFQMPSIALRGSRSVLTHYQELERLSSDSVELGISYGLIRYVVVSVAARQEWEKGKTAAREDFLLLTSEDLPSWTSNKTKFSWGMTISPFTPFVQIGFEQSYWDRQTQLSLAKLSFLL